MSQESFPPLENLKTKDGVVSLMRGSKSIAEWMANRNKVKLANNGYPDFWDEAVAFSGLASEVQKSWSK